VVQPRADHDAGQPGYKNASVNVSVEASQTKTVSITLLKSTFADEVWDGFRAVILPYREPPDYPNWASP
jgi:hypothetical protein